MSSLAAGPEMACRTCRRVLNRFTKPTGSVAFVHPVAANGYDHDPDPILAAHLDRLVRWCDFCSDPHPILTLRSEPVRAVALGEGPDLVQDFGDTWDTCIACMALIQARRPDSLWRRAVAGIGLPDNDLAARSIREVQAAVLATLQSGRTLIVSADWPHTPIAASALPKIRDRLVALLRGDIGLPPPLHRLRHRGQVADGLSQAHLFHIDAEFTDLARHAATGLPDTSLTPELLPTPHGLLTWSAPVDGYRVCAASWTTTGHGIRVVLYRSVGADVDGPPLQTLREQVGWLVPTRHDHLHTNTTITTTSGHAVLVSTWLLIAQHATETVPATVERAIRKAYARSQRPAPEVRLVRIRGRSPNPGSGRPMPRQLRLADTHRRWVSGFWRQQPYGPARSLRKPKYVFAYLRGPHDAPIVASTTVRVLASPPPPSTKVRRVKP